MDILLLAPTFLIAIVCLKSRNAFFNLVLLFHHGFGYLEFLVFSSLHINKCFIWIILIYHQRNTCSPAGGMYVSISHCLRMECEAKWALGRITTNKASGGDGISVELFQILKEDAVKVLHSIWEQIWKTQQWPPQDWKRSVFVPIPKKGNAKECSHCRTSALISHASKVMLKILQVRLQ